MDSKSELIGGNTSGSEQRFNWSEKRAGLLARVDLQASAIIDFNSKLQEIPQDSTAEEISENVLTLERGIRSKFPVLEQIDSMKVLVGLRELDKEDTGPGKKNGAVKRLSVLQEMFELQSNPNVKFLVDIQTIARGLRRKTKKVAQMKDEYSANKDGFFKTYLPKGVPTGSVNEVRFFPFEVRFLMKNIDASIEPNLAGFHVPESPMSFIKEGVRSGETARHESLHNILDDSRELKHKGSFFTIVDLVRIVHRDAAPEVAIEAVLKLIKSPYLELDSVRNEFMAQFEEALRNNFFAEIEKDPYVYDLEEDSKRQAIDSLSTAGSEIGRVKESFLRFADSINDSGAQEKIRNYVKAVDGAVLKTLHYLNDSFEIAKRLEDESAVDYLRAACFVLKPSQYRHLESYLEFKYGEAKIMDIKRSINIARELNPSLESLEFAESALLRGEILDLDKEVIKSKLSGFGSILYENVEKRFTFHSMPELRKFIASFKEIAGLAGVEQDDLEMMTQGLTFDCLVAVFHSFDFDGNDSLIDLYTNLEEPERDQFKEAFSEWVNHILAQQLADSDHEIDLGKTSVLKIASELGLEQRLHEELEWVSRVRNEIS